MDRALKERIIGAVVLVVFVVLVVPVFLDGPEGPTEVQTRSIPLPGQSEQPDKVVVLPRDRTEPMPAPVVQPQQDDAASPDEASEPPAAAESADDDAVVVAAAPETAAAILEDDDEPTPEPARSEPVAPSPAATGMWAVQLGSFSSEANANRLAAELKRKGFGAFLSRVPGSSGELLRVRVGPQENRQAATRMAERLDAAGYEGQVVPYR
ncbi:MAG: SPOR domain-containing protein [Pseudomonadota bacterium]